MNAIKFNEDNRYVYLNRRGVVSCNECDNESTPQIAIDETEYVIQMKSLLSAWVVSQSDSETTALSPNEIVLSLKRQKSQT